MASPKKPVSIAPGASATPAQLGEEARSELEQTQKELKEIDLLLQQTSTEVDRLAQRNAQAASTSIPPTAAATKTTQNFVLLFCENRR